MEGTLGQWSSGESSGNGIFLVEAPEDVGRLEVKQPANIAFVTQTTLSVDDTKAVIEALQ